MKMPCIKYVDKKFGTESLNLIEISNKIIEDYEGMGYSLTLRQLYYQLVARGFIENNDKSYNRIGNIINDARLAGLVNWYSISDRTRNLKSNPHWENGSEFIKEAIPQFKIDLRKTQDWYIEVWVEKEALVDIVGQISEKLDVPYFACRGYVSQSEMWRAAQRMIESGRLFNKIIHLGDHDPSGIDMTRDIEDRMELFDANVSVDRIALNFDQIEEYNPPPNPAKVTDSRASVYMRNYGSSSWELDALSPEIIENLIKDKIDSLTDFSELQKQKEFFESEKKDLILKNGLK